MDNIKAEIISIGNEILSGWTLNTNAFWMSQKLHEIGLPVGWMTTIPDTAEEIENALLIAGKRANVILCTGGLGPTPDDITKKSVARFFNVELKLDEEVLKHVKKLFVGRNLNMPDININQALVPVGAEIIHNPLGTAPGLYLTQNNRLYFFMPGVPQEMKQMIAPTILDHIQGSFKLPLMTTHILRTTGIAESRLFEKLEPILLRYSDINPSFLPKITGVDIKLSVITLPKGQQNNILQFLADVREEIEKYIYTDSEMDMQEIIGQILRGKSLSLSVTESFTGGLISDWLTDIPGSSDYYLGSVLTYSNESKMRELGVAENTLSKFGAVSEETALEMVRGIQRLYKSDCAIATTGIAGPGGATDTKPVGLCYVSAMYKKKVFVKKFNFGGNRRVNKIRGAMAGLESLRRLLLNI